MELIHLLISQPSTSYYSLWYSRLSIWNPAAARGCPEWDTFVFPTRPTGCFFSIAFSLPTSSCTFLFLAPKTTYCVGVQSILCTLKPLLKLDFSFIFQDIHACRHRNLHTQTRHKDPSVYLLASWCACVPYPSFYLVVASFLVLEWQCSKCSDNE